MFVVEWRQCLKETGSIILSDPSICLNPAKLLLTANVPEVRTAGPPKVHNAVMQALPGWPRRAWTRPVCCAAHRERSVRPRIRNISSVSAIPFNCLTITQTKGSASPWRRSKPEIPCASSRSQISPRHRVQPSVGHIHGLCSKTAQASFAVSFHTRTVLCPGSRLHGQEYSVCPPAQACGIKKADIPQDRALQRYAGGKAYHRARQLYGQVDLPKQRGNQISIFLF